MIRPAAMLLVVVAACTSAGSERSSTTPPPSVHTIAESAVIRSGPIGMKLRKEGTYVLVEADNGSKEPRLVAVEGELLDAKQAQVAELSIDQLYVPAGERRTFALVAPELTPTATAVHTRVRSAPVADYAPEVTIDGIRTEPQPDGLLTQVSVVNRMDRQVLATIIVTFFDDHGAILSRPFIIDTFPLRASRPIFFKGPLGATRAQAFVGDTIL